MNSEIQYFAYTACDDLEEWIVDSNIDYWAYSGMYRFRKKHGDNIFFVLYEYSTQTLSTEINKLCFVPSLFHTDIPETILSDIVETTNIILRNKEHCVTFFPNDQLTNFTFMQKILENSSIAKISSVYIDDKLSHFLVST